MAPRHAILAGNTPTFLPRLAHAQILRRTLPRGEMASGLIGRKRRLSQHVGAGNKHKNGYNPDWKVDFPWHVPVNDSSDSEATATGGIVLFCSICKRHRTKQKNNAGNWTARPCKNLRRDVLQRHRESSMHREAQELESTRLASERDGGIRQAFSSRVLVHRKAIIGTFHLLYWLAKEEIAHTTKFNSLKDLAIRLGCDYLRELVRGKNAQYSSDQIVAELLQCLSLVIEEQIVAELLQCLSLVIEEQIVAELLQCLSLVIEEQIVVELLQCLSLVIEEQIVAELLQCLSLVIEEQIVAELLQCLSLVIEEQIVVELLQCLSLVIEEQIVVELLQCLSLVTEEQIVAELLQCLSLVTEEQIVAELLQCLSLVIEEQIVVELLQCLSLVIEEQIVVELLQCLSLVIKGANCS